MRRPLAGEGDYGAGFDAADLRRPAGGLGDAVAATDIQLDAETLAALDRIFPGPGGAAPEAYAW